MLEILDMGGHGIYIWFSYTIIFFGLIIGFLLPIKKRKVLINKLAGKAKE